jgi:hypothetical protein
METQHKKPNVSSSQTFYIPFVSGAGAGREEERVGPRRWESDDFPHSHRSMSQASAGLDLT